MLATLIGSAARPRRANPPAPAARAAAAVAFRRNSLRLSVMAFSIGSSSSTAAWRSSLVMDDHLRRHALEIDIEDREWISAGLGCARRATDAAWSRANDGQADYRRQAHLPPCGPKRP